MKKYLLIEVMILLDVEINQLDNLDLDILNAKILIHRIIINHDFK